MKARLLSPISESSNRLMIYEEGKWSYVLSSDDVDRFADFIKNIEKEKK